MSEETIFERILKGEIPCEEVYSDDQCLVFRDIQPVAPIHLLIIPRQKLTNLKDAKREDKNLLGHLLLVASKVAQDQGLEHWRTIINNGSEAGQTVFYLHIHVIGGRLLNWPPG